MFELYKDIYTLLDVTSITDVATGGIAPLLAEQKVINFVNYSFGSLEELTKDKRVQLTLKVDCYAVDLKKGLQIFDAVDAVLKTQNAKLVDFDSMYLEETNDCAVYAVFNITRIQI